MVNVTDYQNDDLEIPEKIWESILNFQGGLHEKYVPIEKLKSIGAGLLLTHESLDIDHFRHQYYLKDMMWRVTEELAEAAEAEWEGHQDHYHEELIDALHFQMELSWIIGFRYEEDLFLSPGEYLESWAYESTEGEWGVVYWLGLAANCLKNKPWKQDFRETDRNKLLNLIRTSNEAMRRHLHLTVGNDEDIFRLYMSKHKVNQFRIRSNY